MINKKVKLVFDIFEVFTYVIITIVSLFLMVKGRIIISSTLFILCLVVVLLRNIKYYTKKKFYIGEVEFIYFISFIGVIVILLISLVSLILFIIK